MLTRIRETSWSQLPQPKHEVIDAKCRIGAIYSDFNGPARHWAGSKLIQDSPAADAKSPSQHVELRLRVGGMAVIKIDPVPAQIPQAVRLQTVAGKWPS